MTRGLPHGFDPNPDLEAENPEPTLSRLRAALDHSADRKSTHRMARGGDPRMPGAGPSDGGGSFPLPQREPQAAEPKPVEAVEPEPDYDPSEDD